MLGVLNRNGTNVIGSLDPRSFVLGQFTLAESGEEAKPMQSKSQFRGSVFSIIVVFAALVLFIVAAVISARP